MTQSQTVTKAPFPVRAASVAIWAPVAAIILTFVARSAMKGLPASPTANLILDVITGGLIVSGFFCSIIALLGNRRRRMPGVVARSLIGLLLCGGIILANVFFLFFFHPFDSMYPKYYGTWINATSTANAAEVLELRANKQYHHVRTAKPVKDELGTWDFKIEHETKKIVLCLYPDLLSDGSPNTQHKAYVIQLDEIEPNALHILAEQGRVTYHRWTPGMLSPVATSPLPASTQGH
jgi:hypothetical protein